MLDPAAMRAAGLHVRRDRPRRRRRTTRADGGDRPRGGKAERLGEAGGGRPKSLVPVGGRPLLAWQVGRLARAGVDRVIVSCSAGQESEFVESLADAGVELVCAGEPERLGRGGGIRYAAGFRRESGDVLAMNGDELVDVDFDALLDRHGSTGAAATVTVAQPPSQFGQVDLTDDDVVIGFHEVSRVPYWVNCGIYVLSAEALARFPEKGDHETTIFPDLAAEGRLRGVPAHGALADGQHAEGASPRGRVRRRASGVARVSDGDRSPYAVAPRRVEKPWGYELVWAEADAYVGKLLFVRAGQSLSLQYHEVKDESWLVQRAGRRSSSARSGASWRRSRSRPTTRSATGQARFTA